MRKRNYIVRAVVPITVCISVKATSKKAAIEEADMQLDTLMPLYEVIGMNDLDRPPMIGAEPGWFEDTDHCGFFIGSNVTVEEAK